MKDTDNILDINPWSGGEYNNFANIDNGTDRNGTLQITNQHSTIGEKSIKLKNSSRWWFYILFNGILNKTYKVTADIYNPNVPVRLTLLGSDKDVIINTIVPVNDSWQTISISGTLTNADEPHIQVYLMDPNINDYAFIDNISIIQVQ